MPDYLQRNQAPLDAAEWAAIDQAVVRTAQSVLVGRRFISLVGPFGAGIEVLPNDVLAGGGNAQIDLLGTAEDQQAIRVQDRAFLPLPLIYKDFWVHWRDLEASHQLAVPLDTGKAAAAAAATALSEDRLIFDGSTNPRLPGLRSVDGRHTFEMGDWSRMGQGFADVVQAIRVLTTDGFPGPYALAVSTRAYADLNRIFDTTGVLELEQIEKLARRGVYPTPVLPEPSAVLVDSGAQNMDLAVAQDMSTAYVETSNLNHLFRVVESLVLRVRRPAAICVMQPATPSPRGRAER